ncbi:hypothetical protein RGU12_00120 [Fredinandcohnia sp. QZ13]|uniref:hypothetical protein n=1 Tax=Fredinandcohnia sp. QZ13 TaxID=3073144 RepID=UPI002853152C|nr:hypothetical protein [Fredinandcohnia sp. QZ13]MDR4885948.1 hypothetical protein [Fredinandcohnia sp. QZ13]
MTKVVGKLFLTITFVLLLTGCTSNKTPPLKGAYQSEHVEGYFVQMSFQPEEQSFVEYIDNREVDKGTYKELENDVYKIYSDIQEFEIKLNKDNSFDLIVKKINEGKPIKLKNIDVTPIYFGTEFDDVDEYKALIE